MTTSAQIATRALRRLGIVRPDESPSAEDQASAIEALEEMTAEWTGDGIIYPETEYPLDSRFQGGIIAMLAQRIADEHGVTASAKLNEDADSGRMRLEAAYIVPPPSRFELSLTLTATNFLPTSAIYNTESSTPAGLPTWIGGKEYIAGFFVKNGDNAYKCVTSGTSASSGGPTDTGSDITDGTVLWSFVSKAS